MTEILFQKELEIFRSQLTKKSIKAMGQGRARDAGGVSVLEGQLAKGIIRLEPLSGQVAQQSYKICCGAIRQIRLSISPEGKAGLGQHRGGQGCVQRQVCEKIIGQVHWAPGDCIPENCANCSAVGGKCSRLRIAFSIGNAETEATTITESSP